MMDKKVFGVGLCLMLLGLTMVLGSPLLPNDTMDWRMLQVSIMIIGLMGFFLMGLGLVFFAIVSPKEENPEQKVINGKV